MNDFKRGDQIAYIPDHAEGNINHPDVEFGFVTSTNPHYVFVRYWWNARSGRDINTLKSRNSGTPTYRRHLVLHNNHPQETIDKMLAKL